jgi:hypothetical protein
MGMDLFFGGIADAPLASESIDGEATVDPSEIVGTADPVDVDPADTEFWDACWTLEDEWLPRAIVRSEPQRQDHRANPLPEVFVLL